MYVAVMVESMRKDVRLKKKEINPSKPKYMVLHMLLYMILHMILFSVPLYLLRREHNFINVGTKKPTTLLENKSD